MLSLSDTRQRGQHDCGAAVCACVLAHFGVSKPLSYFVGKLHTNAIDGTDPRVIESFLRAEGLRVLSGEMEPDDLQWHTKQGRPVIALVTFSQVGHYVVVAGVSRGKVYYQCPIDGPGSAKVAHFSFHWHDSGRFGERFAQFGLAVWR